MKYSNLLLSGALGTLGTLALAAGSATPAPEPAAASAAFPVSPNGPEYEVTVTNLTLAQTISPVLVTTHSRAVSLFELGEPASPELALLAEDGDNTALRAVLDGTAGVGGTASGTGGIPAGASETIRITSDYRSGLFSVAGMLITSNDAFGAVNGARLPLGRQTLSFLVPAYDAGSERNSELCAYIPGPPCGNGGAHDPAPAEGFVHVSNGIQGVGDVNAARYDWRNPVMRVEVKRVR